MNSKGTQCNLFLIDNLQIKNDAEKKKEREANKVEANFNLLKKLKEKVTNKGANILAKMQKKALC